MPDAFDFDANLLQQRGLTSETGAYFARGPRFRPGEQSVGVRLNGRDIGRHTALFGPLGELCLNAEFLHSAGIEPVSQQPVPPIEGPDCGERADWAARVEVRLEPATGGVLLTVPEELVRPVPPADTHRHGGLGAALNYQVFLTDNRGSAGRSTFRYVFTEAGFNFDDWMLRSRQTYTQADDRGRFHWAGAWLQRSFPAARRLLQAGRIGTADALYGGLPLTGLQWLPETALRGQARFPLEGLAAGRSRLELRQGGVLIHTTFVPAGPFRLTDYPLRDAGLDLELRLIDETGGQRSTVVPATSLLLASGPAVADGWSVAAGRLWDPTENRSLEARPLMLGSYDFAAGSDWNHSTGALLASGYRSVALSTAWHLSPQSSAQGQWMGTDDLHRNRQGSATSALFSAAIAEPVRLGVSARWQTLRFDTLTDAAQLAPAKDDSTAMRSRLAVQLTVVETWARGLSAGLSQDRNHRGAPRQTYHLGWGTNLLGATLQLGVSRSYSRTGSEAAAASADATSSPANPVITRPGTQAYATLTFPLGSTGSGNSSSYLRSTGDAVQSGSAVSQRVSENISWRASVDRQSDSETGGQRLPASNIAALQATLLPRYAEVGLGVSQGSGSFGRHAEMTGSMVATGDGVAFGAAPVQDTFGTVRLGGIAGIRVDGMSGSAWSGPGGLAAIASLLPFQESRLEIWGPSVPLDVNVDRGLVTLQAARGAVVRIDMGAHRVRRMLLSLTDAAGQPLPAGSTVHGAEDMAATVGRAGRVLVEWRDAPGVLRVRWPDGGECLLGDIATDGGAQAGPFESGRASCLRPPP